jgi:hypothetical protein
MFLRRFTNVASYIHGVLRFVDPSETSKLNLGLGKLNPAVWGKTPPATQFLDNLRAEENAYHYLRLWRRREVSSIYAYPWLAGMLCQKLVIVWVPIRLFLWL